MQSDDRASKTRRKAKLTRSWTKRVCKRDREPFVCAKEREYTETLKVGMYLRTRPDKSEAGVFTPHRAVPNASIPNEGKVKRVGLISLMQHSWSSGIKVGTSSVKDPTTVFPSGPIFLQFKKPRLVFIF